jgi:hypothetical protein
MIHVASDPDAWLGRILLELRGEVAAAREAEHLAISRLEQDLAAFRDTADLPASIARLEREIAELLEDSSRLAASLAEIREERERRRREDQEKLLAEIESLLAGHRLQQDLKILEDAADFTDRLRRSTSSSLAELSPRQLDAFLAQLEAGGTPQRVRQEIRARFLAVREATCNAFEERQQAEKARAENEARRQQIEGLRRELARQHQVSAEVLAGLMACDLRSLRRLSTETLKPGLELVRGEREMQLPPNVLAEGGQPGKARTS